MAETKHSHHIAYGNEQFVLPLPSKTDELLVAEPPMQISPTLFRQRLDDSLHHSPLDLSRPIIVVADKTRLCGYPEYLPILIDTLQEKGMDLNQAKIIIAYGTHARQSDEECLQAFGELYTTCTFVHHDCHDTASFRELGTTSRGTPIRFRQDLLEASAVITMGAICHHYFAGYGGGRKLIFPGCGEREAIYANHGLYLDGTTKTLAAGCQPGLLNGNPLAEDLFEVEAAFSAHLAIHGILDTHGQLCDLLVGSGSDHFLAACQQHGRSYERPSRTYDTVIASCGGYPKDINFIQSHKSIHNAAMFVRDGGLLLVYCECRDGIGSKTFLPWFEKGSFNAAFNLLAARYEGNGGTALATMTKARRIRIGLVTSLNDALCKQIGLEKWHHDQVCRYLTDPAEHNDIAFIANAGMLVKV